MFTSLISSKWLIKINDFSAFQPTSSESISVGRIILYFWRDIFQHFPMNFTHFVYVFERITFFGGTVAHFCAQGFLHNSATNVFFAGIFSCFSREFLSTIKNRPVPRTNCNKQLLQTTCCATTHETYVSDCYQASCLKQNVVVAICSAPPSVGHFCDQQ